MTHSCRIFDTTTNKTPIIRFGTIRPNRDQGFEFRAYNLHKHKEQVRESVS